METTMVELVMNGVKYEMPQEFHEGFTLFVKEGTDYMNDGNVERLAHMAEAAYLLMHMDCYEEVSTKLKAFGAVNQFAVLEFLGLGRNVIEELEEERLSKADYIANEQQEQDLYCE